jgi:DNA-binding GntR family transcriptional regulator
VPEPAYQRIASDLRERILSGEIPPGSKLPSRRLLMAAHGVKSDRPVVEAMRLLAAEGLVRPVQGAGTYVREQSPLRQLAPAWDTPPPGTTAITDTIRARPGRVSDHLPGVTPGEPVLEITRTWWARATALAASTQAHAGAEAVYPVPPPAGNTTA